ncbi:MAG TPA: caspase family protein [Dermatophilaceae bacterium]|jgi:hypothetical protein|nr:caspase family protein [Dermatophilaceae bacterium]HMT90487.1 caspase family protein [Dermatophilaceae bacterium]
MTPTGDADFVAVVIAIPRPAWGLLRHLPGAVRDAERWRMALGTHRRYDPVPNADAAGIEQVLVSAMSDLCSGGRLLVTFSGHGVAFPVTDAHGELVSFDQAVVANDGPILNGMFGRLWRTRPDLEVLAIVDACHSQGALERLWPDRNEHEGPTPVESGLGVPTRAPAAHLPAQPPDADQIRAALRTIATADLAFPLSTERWDVAAARLVHVASCAADERSRETPEGGYFTQALLSELQYADSRASIRAWLSATARRIDPMLDQHMNATYVGERPDFLDSPVGFG